MSEVQEVVGRVTLEDRFSGNMGKLQGSLNKLSHYGGRAAGALDRNLGRIAVVATGAALYGAKRVVQAAADYQDAMAQVEKTLAPGSKVPANLNAINAGLLQLSKRLPMTAVDLADIARQAGQLGIESAPEMLAFTETVAKLASVTDISVGFASENMGKLRTIFSFSGDQIQHFGNVLVALENNAASSVTEILNISRRFAFAGKQAGLSADQVAAFASTVASLGVNPEAAGSALSRIFNRTAIEIANASKKAKAFANFMHMPFKKFKESYVRDPEQFFLNFFKRLSKVFKDGSNLDKLNARATLKAMGFNNVRDVNVIQALADGYGELTRQLGIAKNASTELEQASQSRFAAFTQQWQIFKNNVTASMIDIGNQLLPAIGAIFPKIEAFMNSHKDMFIKFGQDVAHGITSFVDMLTPDNLNKAVDAIKQFAGYGKAFVDAFLGMPDWARNILIGLYAGNKLTGGVVADIIGDVGGGLFKQFLGRGSPGNPMFVVPMGGGIGGGGGGGLGFGGGAAGVAGVGASAVALIAGMVLTYNATLDRNNQIAGGNINSTEYLANHGSNEEIRAAIARLQDIPNTLSPIQKALYDLNYQGVKTHNEDLIAYLQSHSRALKDDKYIKPLDPKKVVAAVQGFASKAISIWNFLTGKQEVQNELIRGLPSSLRPAPTKITTNAKTSVTVNLTVDGQKVATAVYNSTSSTPSTYMGGGNIRGGAD